MSYPSTEHFLAERDDLTGRGLKLCPSCGGRCGRVRWTRGCKAPDPQTEETCDTCEGRGVIDDYADSHLSL